MLTELDNLSVLQSIDQLDASILRWAKCLGCEDFEVTPLISAEQLERAGYPKAFPQLVLYAQPNQDTGKSRPAYALSPAVCYHAYIRLAGQTLNSLRQLTARGYCFRNEAQCEPGRRQIEFQMRELIFVGSAELIDKVFAGTETAVRELAASVGLVASWQSASDPFFLPSARGRALMQRLLNTKRELCLADGLAIASVNRHQSFFGERFAIRMADGTFAHSACLAFGLDRWQHAMNVPPPSSTCTWYQSSIA